MGATPFGQEGADGEDRHALTPKARRRHSSTAEAPAQLAGVVCIGVGLEGGATLPMLGVGCDDEEIELCGPTTATHLRLYVGGHLETRRNDLCARVSLRSSVEGRRLLLSLSWAGQTAVQVKLVDAVSGRVYVSTTVDVNLTGHPKRGDSAPDVSALRAARARLCKRRVKPALASGAAGPPFAFKKAKGLNHFRTALRKCGAGSYLFGRADNAQLYFVASLAMDDGSSKIVDVPLGAEGGRLRVPGQGFERELLRQVADVMYTPEVGASDRALKDELRVPPLRELWAAGDEPLPDDTSGCTEAEEAAALSRQAPAAAVSRPVGNKTMAQRGRQTPAAVEQTAAASTKTPNVAPSALALAAQEAQAAQLAQRKKREAVARAVALPLLLKSPEGCSVGLKFMAQLGWAVEDAGETMTMAASEAKAGLGAVARTLELRAAAEVVGPVLAAAGLASLGKKAAAELETAITAALEKALARLAQVGGWGAGRWTCLLRMMAIPLLRVQLLRVQAHISSSLSFFFSSSPLEIALCHF